MYASKRSVSKSRYTLSEGVSFLPCVNRQQAAYGSAVAAANHQLLNSVHVTHNDKKSGRKSLLSKLAVKFARCCSVRKMSGVSGACAK